MFKPNTKLPTEIQSAVDAHVLAISTPIFKSKFRERNIFRNHKMDARKSLSKGKKLAKRHDLIMTPFVLIGAWQNLQRRAARAPTSLPKSLQTIDDKNSLAEKMVRQAKMRQLDEKEFRNMTLDIQNAEIQYEWFQFMADEVLHKSGQKVEPQGGKGFHSCKTLILREAMAMVVRPFVQPYLPSYAWALQEADTTSNDTTKTTKLEVVAPKSHCIQANAIAKQVLEERYQNPTTKLYCDLAALGSLTMTELQIRIICNILEPYVSNWWIVKLRVLILKNQPHLGLSNQRKKIYTVSKDPYSSLTPLLVDILLLALEHSQSLNKHKLWHQLKLGDRSKQKSLTNPKEDLTNSQLKEEDEDVWLQYVRYGSGILLLYNGPKELAEKLQRAVSQDLKSSLGYDKRFVEDAVWYIVQTKKMKKKQQQYNKKTTPKQPQQKRAKDYSS